jgi:hypothetical protein
MNKVEETTSDQHRHFQVIWVTFEGKKLFYKDLAERLSHIQGENFSLTQLFPDQSQKTVRGKPQEVSMESVKVPHHARNIHYRYGSEGKC